MNFVKSEILSSARAAIILVLLTTNVYAQNHAQNNVQSTVQSNVQSKVQNSGQSTIQLEPETDVSAGAQPKAHSKLLRNVRRTKATPNKAVEKVTSAMEATAAPTASALAKQGNPAQLQKPAGLTWQKALEITRAENADLLAAQQALESSRQLLKAAYGKFLPTISGELAYSESNSQISNSQAGGTANGANLSSAFGGNRFDSKEYGASLNAKENLFNGFLDEARVQQAKATVRQQEAAYRITAAQVSFDLKSAFASALYAQEALQVLQEIQKRREQNASMVNLRFESGNENRGSLLLSQAYLGQANYDVLEAQHQQVIAIETLAKVLGRAQASLPQEVDTQMPETQPPVSPDFVSLAQDTPQHAQALAQQENAQGNVKISRGAFLPSLDLTGSVGEYGPNWFPNTNRWTVGAAISLPLFNGGSDYFGLQSAHAAYRAAAYRLESTDQQTLIKLKQSFIDFIESIARLNVDEKFLEATSVRAQIGRAKYNNGLLGFDAWDIIESDLINREKALVASRRDRRIREASWEQAQGKGAL